ncbi:hypothetical protein F0562_006116 [Nyssa sinensis]|uniref:non-specific serine/threonine protein kinase n=1 Tax=Nyssa sinensis TaxID=561372 RepID=A0A5J5AMG1_9ASTE|nr:hypothetical protein F0562_006116 [Nyssa sinensis]
MGGCVSLHGNASFLKRTRRPNSQLEDGVLNESHRSRTRSPRFSRPINILKDPSGDDIFKRYQFGKELGRGEFGITFQCCDNDTGETLACKRISKSRLKTEIDIEDVKREVEIMRHLPAHPNIVRYKEVYEDKDAVYLIMELCKGGELFDRIVSRGHYTERAAAIVTKTIIEVVQVCHEHGVIHRDLKPENFLYANSCENAPLKAIDFGLSIFFEPGQRFSEIVGSPLLHGSRIPPFWAETEEGIAHAIIRCEIDFDRDPWPKVSEDAKDLVRGMLEANPYSRMTVEEVLEHRWIQNANKVPNVPLGEKIRTRIKQFSLMNKFKKKVLRVVAYNLPDEQVNGIKQIFHMMDTDKNGNLNFDELKHGLTMIGHPVADPDVQMLMDAADVDGSGTINYEEFVTMSVHLKKMSADEQLLQQAFHFFDKNQSRYIEFEELREVLLDDNLGPNNDQVIEGIIFDVDLDKDGRISYDEFKAMMTTGMDWRMASRQYSRAMLNALSQKMFKDKSMQLKN